MQESEEILKMFGNASEPDKKQTVFATVNEH